MWISRTSREPETRKPDRALELILAAVVLLTVFYYFTRVDTISVGSPVHASRAMTLGRVGFLRHNLAALVLLGAVPLLLAWKRCRMRPVDLGLAPGNWRRGLFWLGIGLPVAVLAAFLSAREPVMRAVYPLEPGLQPHLARFAGHVAGQLAYYIGWELLFRGVLLFGLQRRLGFAGANVVQTALSVLAHFGRPFPEALAAIPAGLAFGGIARDTRSIWWVTLIHLTVGAVQDWFIIR